MGKWTIIRLAGGMLNLTATATGYALDLSEVTKISANWWPLVTLVLGIILVGWVVLELYGQNKGLLDAKPTIDVELVKEYYTYYLKVHNKGETGTFKAQFELTSEDPDVWQLPFYDGHWRLSNSSQATIMRDHSDMIKVAESVMQPNGYSVFLHIFYSNAVTKAESYINTSSHLIGATVKDKNGENERPSTKWEYKLKATISASPSLREGIYHNYYKLSVDKLEADSTPLSSPDKEDSQNQ